MRAKPTTRRAVLSALAVAAAAGAPLLGPRNAAAQAGATAAKYPERAVKLIVPFPPGGATDIVGRRVAQRMSEVWGQQVIVENRPGAGTVIGTQIVANSPPDGYTLGMVITAHVINPSLRANMPFDTVRDLAGVTQVNQAHLVLAAHPSFEADNVAELIALARKDPGKLSYATPGSGTAMHLAMEQLKIAAGIDLIHVPYKGGAPALQDVLSGRVPIFTDVLYSAMPHIKSGKLKVLALMSPQRVATSPEYPLITETVPGVSATSILGIVVPRATPRDLVERISADIAREVKSSTLTTQLQELGTDPVGSKPEEYDAKIREEIDKWSKVVRTARITVD